MIGTEDKKAVRRPRLEGRNDDKMSTLEGSRVFVAIGLEADTRYPQGDFAFR